MRWTKISILFFLLLSSLLLLYFRGVFSATLNVSSVDPIIIVRPEIFSFYSSYTLYVRDTSLTVSAGIITSVTVTVYNDGTPRSATVYVYVYDDVGNLIGSGSGTTQRIPRRGTRSVSITLTPQPQLSQAYRVEVSVGDSL